MGAEAIHRDTNELELSDASRLRYDKLLLATGSSPRKLTVPGAELDGVQYLRKLGESDEPRAAIEAGNRAWSSSAVAGSGSRPRRPPARMAAR